MVKEDRGQGASREGVFAIDIDPAETHIDGLVDALHAPRRKMTRKVQRRGRARHICERSLQLRLLRGGACPRKQWPGVGRRLRRVVRSESSEECGL